MCLYHACLRVWRNFFDEGVTQWKLTSRLSKLTGAFEQHWFGNWDIVFSNKEAKHHGIIARGCGHIFSCSCWSSTTVASSLPFCLSRLLLIHPLSLRSLKKISMWILLVSVLLTVNPTNQSPMLLVTQHTYMPLGRGVRVQEKDLSMTFLLYVPGCGHTCSWSCWW